MIVSKKKIALIYGGNSQEHVVSLRSALGMFENLDKNKYDIILIGITRDGEWFLEEPHESSFKNIIKKEDKRLSLIPAKGIYHEGKKLHIDTCLLGVHGDNFEDGRIQAILECVRVKYTGSKFEASAIGINKRLSKEVVEKHGILIVPYKSISKDAFELQSRNELESWGDSVIKELKLPLFVKANSLGSSVGVFKVTSKEEMFDRIRDTFKLDDEVLIEKAIIGKEIECAVLEKDDKINTYEIGEIVLENNEFYDFDNKYSSDSKAKTIIPASLDKSVREKTQTIARNIFKILGCSGYARVDFFYLDNNIYFNEINTLPGFTEISMFPKMVTFDGRMTYKDVVESIIEASLK